MIERLAVIGVGLIGGSLAKALRAAGAVGEIIGCGRGWTNLERALALGVIDHATDDPGRAAAKADVIFIAAPLGAMHEIFAAIKGKIMPHTVITDAGSVKDSVIQDVIKVFGAIPANFVPGHPIAGTEHSGVEAALVDLYQGRRVILTPLSHTSRKAIDLVERIWLVSGAVVTHMEAARHDEILAATSHLPHMLAFSLVDVLARMQENDEIFKYAAGGFRDFTRIASSNPVMWRDICIANRNALQFTLQNFAQELNNLANALNNSEGTELLKIFTRAKAARDRYLDGISDAGE
jgi:prephenate dehydrogenase